MSEGKTNPGTEVEAPQLSMFDVMFGSDESTNPEQTIEEPVVYEEEAEHEIQLETQEVDSGDYEVDAEEAPEETETRYVIKVDGEEHEVTLEELRNGYQRQADYTRKSQALAEQRKAYEANLQAVQSEREQYGQALQLVANQQQAELQQYENIDWKALKDDDPMEYMEKRLEYQEARERLSRIEVERNRVYEQNKQEYTQRLSQVLQQEAAKLSEALPEYANPSSTLKNDLRNYALSLGFSNTDIDSITDHRVVLVLHKAMMQDRAANNTVKKVSKVVPKVVKSGTPESKVQRSQKATQQKRERLAKTGNPRDAASIFLDMIS
jgi:hypothetical protein